MVTTGSLSAYKQKRLYTYIYNTFVLILGPYIKYVGLCCNIYGYTIVTGRNTLFEQNDGSIV